MKQTISDDSVQALAQEKNNNKNWDVRSMPFKALAFCANFKRIVVKTHIHAIIMPKVIVFFTQVTSQCLFIVFENFRPGFSLHAQS